MTSVFSWQNSMSLCLASFCAPRPNSPVTPGISWLPTFVFQSPIIKRTSFLGVSSKRSCRSSLNFSLFSITGWGIHLLCYWMFCLGNEQRSFCHFWDCIQGRFSFQSQRKVMPKNSQTTTQLHSSHASKVMLKILQASLQQYVTHELQMFKLDLEKGEDPEIKLPHLLDHRKSKRIPGKYLLLFYWLHQSLWLYGSQQTVENSSRWE